MANERDLKKAVERASKLPGGGPKGSTSGVSIPPLKKKAEIPSKWTQDAFKKPEKKPVVKKAKGGMVSRGWGCARTK